MAKERIDVIIMEKGLAESRSLAQRLVMAGQVRVDGQVVLKPSIKISTDANVEIDQGPRFVSRGGEKLESALLAFGLLDIPGWICADVGASTGGFTDCLLQHGARRVYAIDVGYGVLHWKLRQDTRVISMERTNARYIQSLPEPVELISIDASFISLKILLPVVASWFPPAGGMVVALIKPQFEAGREESAKGEGVIRDREVHRKVIEEVCSAAQGLNYRIGKLIRSPLTGPKGNIEFLIELAYPGDNSPVDLGTIIDLALNPGA
jgi:23S rRNA (cytidine1920-2'-O)/16S rRNA (cytidine1409-2'-O)-methyltransferase